MGGMSSRAQIEELLKAFFDYSVNPDTSKKSLKKFFNYDFK